MSRTRAPVAGSEARPPRGLSKPQATRATPAQAALRIAALACLGLVAAGSAAPDAWSQSGSGGMPASLPMPGGVSRQPPQIAEPPTPARVLEQAERWRSGQAAAAPAASAATVPPNLPIPGQTFYTPPTIVMPPPTGPRRLRRMPASAPRTAALPPAQLPLPGSVAYSGPAGGAAPARAAPSPAAPPEPMAAPAQAASAPATPPAPMAAAPAPRPPAANPAPTPPTAMAALPPPSPRQDQTRHPLALPPSMQNAAEPQEEAGTPSAETSEAGTVGPASETATRLPVLPKLIPPPLQSSLPPDLGPVSEGPVMHPSLGPSALESPIGVEGVMHARPEPKRAARVAKVSPPKPKLAERKAAPEPSPAPEQASAPPPPAPAPEVASAAPAPAPTPAPKQAKAAPLPSAAPAAPPPLSLAPAPKVASAEPSEPEETPPPSLAEAPPEVTPRSGGKSASQSSTDYIPPPEMAASDLGATSSGALEAEDLPPPPPDLPLPSPAPSANDRRPAPSRTASTGNAPSAKPAAEPKQRVAALEPPPKGSRATPIGAPTIGARRLEVDFALGSASLSESARATVRQVADAYRENGKRIRIVGHASGESSERTPGDHTLANFEISLKRATAVSDELMRLGVEPGAIVVEAVGDRQADNAGVAATRRADIYLE